MAVIEAGVVTGELVTVRLHEVVDDEQSTKHPSTLLHEVVHVPEF